MVIPIEGSYYWIQSRDSLYSIAHRFGINRLTLAQVNRISPTWPLPIGFKLYIPPRPKRSAEINAYVESTGGMVTPSLE